MTDIFTLENLRPLETRVANTRDIALLRIKLVEMGGNECGFASRFVPMLRQSMDVWFELVICCSKTNDCDAPEEKKEVMEDNAVRQSSFNISQNSKTSILLRLLQIHVAVSRLDPTLAEELGRQGSQLILLRLIRYDGGSNLEAEHDRDVVMDLQDLACEIATQTGGSFPIKFAPFSPDDLKSRLPLIFHIGSATSKRLVDSEQKETQVVFIHQVTVQRQSEQKDVGFVMWPSAVALSRWLVTNPDFVRGKTVLELGAGCGLAGLVAARIQQEDKREYQGSVNLTDFNPVVLDNIRRNIHLNNVEHTAKTSELDFYRQTGISNCWLDGEGNTRDQVDVIIAADHICQLEDAIAAANAIYDALRPGGRAVCVCADSKHRFGVDSFKEECKRVKLNVVVSNVANVYDGRLLEKGGMLLTSGYVEGMTLSLFQIEKPMR